MAVCVQPPITGLEYHTPYRRIPGTQQQRDSNSALMLFNVLDHINTGNSNPDVTWYNNGRNYFTEESKRSTPRTILSTAGCERHI
jgi:hypothetical protein